MKPNFKFPDYNNKKEPYFYYCTIDDLREIGIPAPPVGSVGFVEGTVTDKRLQKLIVLISNRINTFTNLFFQPWKKKEITDGTGQQYIYTADLDKIIEIFSVSLLFSDGFSEHVDHDLYVAEDRFVSRGLLDICNDPISSQTLMLGSEHNRFRFYKGNKNWVLNGVFGDIKNLEKIETSLITDISYGDTVIHLASTEGLRDGDFISIKDQSFIINEILSEYDIRIDASLTDIKLDTHYNKVYRYGKIHDEINDAAKRLVIDYLLGPDALNNVETGEILSSGDKFCDYLISEKIDNYTWTKSKRTERERTDESLASNGTGNLYVDNILRKYMAPHYGAFV